jgi:hypothetical protein
MRLRDVLAKYAKTVPEKEATASSLKREVFTGRVQKKSSKVPKRKKADYDWKSK